jgi:hypothetical protein
MEKKRKREIGLLLFLVAALSVINLISMQYFLQLTPSGDIRTGYGNQQIPGNGQQVLSVSNAAGTADSSDAEVYNYVDKKLAKYGYNKISSGDETSVESSTSDEETDVDNEDDGVPASEDEPTAESLEGKNISFNIKSGLG